MAGFTVGDRVRSEETGEAGTVTQVYDAVPGAESSYLSRPHVLVNLDGGGSVFWTLDEIELEG